MILNFTDKELQIVAGWKAWKEGKSQTLLFENIKFKENAVSGILKEGRKKTHTVIKKEDAELSAVCTCPEHRQSFAFCQHAVSLLLQAREAKEDEIIKPQAMASDKKDKFWSLSVSLVQNIEQSIKNQVISLKVKVTKSSAQNNSLLPLIQSLELNQVEGDSLVQLKNDQFIELLKYNAHTPFIKYKESQITSSISPTRFSLSFSRQKDRLTATAASLEGWELIPDSRNIVLYNTSRCHVNIQESLDKRVSKLFLDLFSEGAFGISIVEFLDLSEALSKWFNLQDAHSLLQSAFTPLKPQFHLDLNGTVKKVIGKLEASYGDKKYPLGLNTESTKKTEIIRYDESAETIGIRNISLERSALELLHEAEFAQEEGSSLTLEGETEIQEFIAYTLPKIEKEKWEVSMIGSFRAFALNVTHLALTLKVDPYQENDPEISFSYSFQTPEGKGMKPSDVSRLMKSGKQSFKLKNGKVALLSLKEYELISEALQDSSVRQIGEKFSTVKSNLNYLYKLGINNTQEPKNKTNELYKKNQLSVSFQQSLRSYQKEGVYWLSQTLEQYKSALLADDMGLGKTVQSLAIASHLLSKHSGAVLIVCPASLISNWSAEINKWLPNSPVIEIRGREGKPAISDKTFYITSYPKYLSDASDHHIIKYCLCILDEASMIKNPDSKISQVLVRQPALNKLALTGTPLENSAKDLWAIFQFLKPEYLGSKKSFDERFVKPLKATGYTSALASKRLKAKLDAFVLRRTKAAVLTELPPKTTRVEHCLMNSVQKREAQRVLKEYEDSKASEIKQNVIQKLTTILRLRQIANDPSLITEPSNELSPKTKRLVEILTEADANNKKVIVFSQFAQMLNILDKQLTDQGFSCSKLTGATKKRDDEISKFKDPQGNNVFLISLKAGGYGLNLTEAQIVVHYDPWWNPAVEAQATDRAYRMGQTESVSVLKLISQSSIDERIIELQQSKQNIYSLAIDDQSPNFTELTENELNSLIM